jgi:hypothetical protein
MERLKTKLIRLQEEAEETADREWNGGSLDAFHIANARADAYSIVLTLIDEECAS